MVKRLTVIVMAIAVLGSVALVVEQQATASAPAEHQCPSVSTLKGFKHGPALRLRTQNASCPEVLAIARAMISGVGVTFIGNPNGGAYQFRWKLYGLPGWTCYGDGSGFPEGGAGGDCSKGGASVDWWHANR